MPLGRALVSLVRGADGFARKECLRVDESLDLVLALVAAGLEVGLDPCAVCCQSFLSILLGTFTTYMAMKGLFNKRFLEIAANSSKSASSQ